MLATGYIQVDPIGSFPDSVKLNPNGTIEVIGNVATGIYNLQYNLCKRMINPEEPDLDYSWSIENCSSSSIVLIINSPLPTHLSKFNAYKEKDAVRLNWSTAFEYNNKGFEIERSADGKQWYTIGIVAAKIVDSNSNNEYTFDDSYPLSGTNLYRLRQVDLDGNYNYSEIKNIYFNQSEAITIFPNPANKNISISGLNGGATIGLLDMSGRLLQKVKTNNKSVNFDLGNELNGIYQLQIINASGKISNHKMVITN